MFHRSSIIASMVGLGISLTLSVPSFAASKPSFPVVPGQWVNHGSWGIEGHIKPIASPGAFEGNKINPPSAITLERPYYYTVQGTPTNGAYQYSYQLSANRHSAVVTVPIGYNPTTHQELIESGIPTPQSLSKIQEPSGGKMVSTSKVTDTTSVPSNAPDPTTSNAYFTSGWTDPLGLTVGQLYTYMTFSWNGTDVTNWSTYGYLWHIEDGDYFYDTQHGGYWNSSTEATGWLTTIEDAPVFGNTKIQWSANNIHVHGNGVITATLDTWAYGPDAWMLEGPWDALNNGSTN